MRLLVKSKIYRAFPELDPFSDERCQRFVQAASRPRWFRALIAACWLFAGAACTASFLAGLWLADDLVPGFSAGHADQWLDVAGVLFALLVYALGAVLALRSRDWLLVRRIRRVLRTKGHCHACGYLLLGTSVSTSHEIACPECGFTTTVDLSLGELASDAQGRTHYQPSEQSLRTTPFGLAPQTWKRYRTRFLRGMIVLSLVLGAAALSWESFLRYQASEAHRLRPGPAGLLALQLSQEPPGTPRDAANSWDAFPKVFATFLDSENAILAASPAPASGRRPYIEYAAIGDSFAPGPGDPTSLDEFRAQRQQALAALDAMGRSSLFAEAREMVDRPRHIWPHEWPASGTAWDVLLPQLGQARRMSRMLGARMYLAAQRDDAEVYAESLHIALGLAHMHKTQPTIIEWLVGQAIESLALQNAIKTLDKPRSAAWLDAIEGEVWRTLDASPPLSQSLKGQRLMGVDGIAFVFEDAARVRFGRHSPGVRAFSQQVGALDLDKPLGTLWQNIAELDRTLGTLDAASRQLPAERASPVSAQSEARYLLSIWLSSNPERVVQPLDQGRTDLAALITLIRIERFRLAHARYPDSLDEVQREASRPLPPDPFSGMPLGYVRQDPMTDPFGREFVVYSVGTDQTDNNGATTPACPAGVYDCVPGTDFIINDPRR